jgi:flagellar biosynthesis chaperone FliJ
MRRFAFRLARVERLRSAERREAHAALAVAIAEAFERQAEREDLERTYEGSLAAELPDDLASIPGALRGLAEWRDGRRRIALEAARRELAAFEKARDAERAHSAAARAHRVLERLHGRRRQAWLEEASRDEQKFLDEIHLLRTGRGRSAEEDRG